MAFVSFFFLTEYLNLLIVIYDSGVCQMGSQFQFCVGIQEQLLPLLLVQDLVLYTRFSRKAFSVLLFHRGFLVSSLVLFLTDVLNFVDKFC